MNKAMFLDRDGTIVKDTGYLHKLSDLKFIPGSVSALKKLSRSEYKIIIMTNQAGIGRGYYTLEQYKKFTSQLLRIFAGKGIRIDAVYHCPHHPVHGMGIYKKRCSCRKPEIGNIKKAQKRFNLVLKSSWFIGDTTADIKAGKDAGCSTILLKTGYAGKDGNFRIKPDYVRNNLSEAIKMILKDEAR